MFIVFCITLWIHSLGTGFSHQGKRTLQNSSLRFFSLVYPRVKVCSSTQELRCCLSLFTLALINSEHHAWVITFNERKCSSELNDRWGFDIVHSVYSQSISFFWVIVRMGSEQRFSAIWLSCWYRNFYFIPCNSALKIGIVFSIQFLASEQEYTVVEGEQRRASELLLPQKWWCSRSAQMLPLKPFCKSH